MLWELVWELASSPTPTFTPDAIVEPESLAPSTTSDKTVEAYASGQFFKDQNLQGKELAEKAEQGDPEAIRQFNELGEHIGRAIANVLFALAPEAIILGGSVSKSYHLFEAGMHSVLTNEFPFQRLYQSLKIEVSDLDNSAVLGASSLVMDAMN